MALMHPDSGSNSKADELNDDELNAAAGGFGDVTVTNNDNRKVINNYGDNNTTTIDSGNTNTNNVNGNQNIGGDMTQS